MMVEVGAHEMALMIGLSEYGGGDPVVLKLAIEPFDVPAELEAATRK
jgi:hypothetical protein